MFLMSVELLPSVRCAALTWRLPNFPLVRRLLCMAASLRPQLERRLGGPEPEPEPEPDPGPGPERPDSEGSMLSVTMSGTERDKNQRSKLQLTLGQ